MPMPLANEFSALSLPLSPGCCERHATSNSGGGGGSPNSMLISGAVSFTKTDLSAATAVSVGRPVVRVATAAATAAAAAAPYLGFQGQRDTLTAAVDTRSLARSLAAKLDSISHPRNSFSLPPSLSSNISQVQKPPCSQTHDQAFSPFLWLMLS